MKVPPKEKWRMPWNSSEVKQLEELASEYLLQGAMNDEAAWMAAENTFRNTTDPFLRNK